MHYRIALLLMLLSIFQPIISQQCGARYKNGGKPLLYGGVFTQCQAGCQPRDDFWGKVCAFNRTHDPGMVCSPEGAKSSFALAETLGGGDILQLSPCALVPYLRGRTLWIIGDSHARFFYRAMQCFLLDFWNHQECQATTDTTANAQLSNLPGAPGGAYCFHLLGPALGRVCMVHAVLGTSLTNNKEVAEGGVLALLQKKFAQPQDIFYINFGIWHKNIPGLETSYVPALLNLGNFYAATKSKFPNMVFRETPAQHSRTGNGKSCAAAKGYLYDPATGSLQIQPTAKKSNTTYAEEWALGIHINWQQRQSWHGRTWGLRPLGANELLMGLQYAPASIPRSLAIVHNCRQTLTKYFTKEYDIPVIATFNITVPLHDNHANLQLVNGQLDCMHYCHPGVPQMWVWLLYDYVRSSRKIKPLPDKAAPGYNLPCVVLQSAM